MKRLLILGLGLSSVLGVSMAAAATPNAVMDTNSPQGAPSGKVAVMPLANQASMPRVLRAERVRRAAETKTVPAEYVGRKFYGSVTYADYITIPTYGLYEFNITDETIEHAPKVISMSCDWMAGARLRDRYYGVRPVSLFGRLTSVGYEEVDIINNKILRTRMTEEGSYADLPTNMAPDFTDGKIYGIMYNADLSGLDLAVFNPETLSFQVTGKFGGKFNPLVFAAAPNGKLYTISPDGDLYTVDKKTGRVSLVDYTGVNVAAYNQSMVWDSKTNKFLWAAVTPTGSKLYALDPETAQATFVMNIPHDSQLTGIYLEEDIQGDNTPAKITDLQLNWEQNGSQKGTATFTLPAVDGQGAALSGSLMVSVWIDSEVYKAEEVMKPGEKVTIPVDLSNDMHQVAVSVRSSKGYAPSTTIYKWAGFDSPKAVTDVQFSVADRQATVTWTASTESEHGGYLDPAKVVYNVWRMPTNELVAEGITESTFIDALPEAVRQYFYRIVPVNTDVVSKPGKSADSNVLVAGEAYHVPYYENWKEEGSEQLFTFVDNDEDEQKWIWFEWNRNWNFTNPGSGKGPCDDWFISPKVALEKDKVYRFTSNLRNSSMTGPETIALAYGTDVNNVSAFTKYGEWLLENGEDTDREYTFEVPEDGKYNMALVNVTQKGTGSSVLVNSIGVELVGSVFAPAVPAEFTVTPDADRLTQATLTFKAPVQDMRGNALSGNLTAKIYRDALEAPVHVMEGIAPGADCTWLDDIIEHAGTHKYRVIFENEHGAGMPAVGSAFIGIYGAPYFEACNSKTALKDFKLEVVGFTYDAQFPPLEMSLNAAEPSFEVTHFNTTEEEHEMYVHFPDMLLEDESVYKLKLDFKNSGYGNDVCAYEMRMGNEADKDMQDIVVGELPKNTLYVFAPQEFTIVNTEKAKKNLSMYIASRRKNDYTYLNFRNISLEYDGSALAPDSITNLRCASEASSIVSFIAPTIDYAYRELKENVKIEIYREGQPIALTTLENVAPGDTISWTDENALLGINKYMIVPENDHGRGRPAYVQAFIGLDVPSTPGDVGITPADDNQTATITWSRVRRGVNGGVLSDDLTYKVIQMVQGEEAVEYKTIKEGLTGTSYQLERTPTETQAMEFYGVVAVTPEGESTPGYYYTVLGKPYSLPFTESFPKGECTTGPWIGMHPAGALQSGPTASEGMATMNTYPQDEDGGSFFFLNGTMMDFESYIPVLTPKVTLKDVESGEISFWLYKGNQSGAYANIPSFSVYGSYNEGDFDLLGSTDWIETEAEWKKYVFPLDIYVGRPGNVIFQLVCRANGYMDFIVMDNFKVAEVEDNSVAGASSDDMAVYGLPGQLLTRGAAGKMVEVYAADGHLADRFISADSARAMASGIYIVRIEGRSFKVNIR